MSQVSEQEIWEALKTVIDPELGINIVDLGLIYEVSNRQQATGNKIEIVMTLTTVGCPLGPWFRETVQTTVAEAAGMRVDDVEVKIVFDPPWHQGLMNEEAIAELGLD